MTPTDLRALLQRPIAFHRIFVDITGSVTAALMLSQAFYWTQHGQTNDGWFWKSRDQWAEETGLSRTEQESARKKLRDIGLLEEELRKVPARLHYRLNMEKLCQLVGGKAPTQLAGNLPTSRRKTAKLYKEAETTEETTKENTKETSVHPPSSGNENGNGKTLTKAQTFYELLKRGYEQKGMKLTWGPPEWANMAHLLKARPDLSEAEFITMLRNRFRSKHVNRSERPMFWLTKLPNYEQGPLNEFGRPLVPTDDDRNAHPDRYYPEYNSPIEED